MITITDEMAEKAASTAVNANRLAVAWDEMTEDRKGVVRHQMRAALEAIADMISAQERGNCIAIIESRMAPDELSNAARSVNGTLRDAIDAIREGGNRT
jgi:hypothetical protein